MIEGAWSRFLGYVAHARTKPTFELEERQPKLETAGRLRHALTTARDGGDWQAPLLEALRPPGRHPFISPRHRLVPRHHRRWLREWMSSDPESARRALAAFLDAGVEPADQVARF